MASWLDLLNALRASLTGATSNSSGRAISGGNTIQRRTNTSNYALVNGSAFVDSISNSGSYVTIRSGAGNDTISNSGSNVVYQYNPSTDGEDVIIGYNSTDTIQVPNSIKSYSTSIDGNDKIIKLGGGSIRLKNAAYKSLKVYAGYVPSGGTTTSSGGTSYSGGSSNGGTSYSGSTSNGGTSYSGGSSYNSNSQSNSKSSTKVTGSSSADYISNYGNYVTICGGAGADTINNSGSNVVYQYNPSTDGQDVIIGYNSTDTIQVPNSIKSYSTSIDGNDKIIKLGGGSIRLKNAAYKSLKVYAGYVPSGGTTTSSGGTSYSGGSSNGGTSYSGSTSNGGTSYSGGSSYNSNSQSNSKSSTKVTGSSSADYISNYGNYVTICGGAGADTINNSGSNVVYQYNPSTDGQDVIIGYNSTDKIQVPNSYTSFSTLNSGNDKIIKIGEGSIRLKDAAYKSVAVYAGYVPNGSSTTSSGGTSYGGGTSYSGGTSNGGTSYSGGTSNGGTGYSGGTSNGGTSYSGGTSNGGTGYSGGTSNGGTSYSGGSSSTTGGGSSYNSVMTRTVTNTDASRITVPKDYQIINASSRTQPIHIETKAADSTIYGGSGDDTLIGRHSVIHGYGGNDSLHGLSGSSILYGDDGNDTLAAASNDSLYGGAGSDVFRYTIGDGKVYIMDYTAQDYIKVTGKYSTLVSGNDAIIRVGSGSSNYITVKNAAHTPLNIIRNSSNYMEEPWFMEDDGDFASSSDMDSILKTSDYSQSTSDSFKNDLTSSLNVSSDALLTSNKLDKSNK